MQSETKPGGMEQSVKPLWQRQERKLNAEGQASLGENEGGSGGQHTLWQVFGYRNGPERVYEEKKALWYVGPCQKRSIWFLKDKLE